MACFVLVHGAWQGGWCWKYVRPMLRAAGHTVYSPTLTGLGERAHLLDERVDLDLHIQDLLAVLECEGLSDVILCGHSYGGMVVTAIADRVPERLRSVVYIDGLVPVDGQCVLDVLPPEIASALKESARATSTCQVVAPGLAKDFAVNAADRDWVDQKNVDHPFRSFEQKIRLDRQKKSDVGRAYIYAAGWSPGLGAPFYETARNSDDWSAHRMECGHYAMIDQPQELTDILVSLAEG